MAKPAARQKETPGVIKAYLLAYNFLSLAAWGYVLYLLISSLTKSNFDTTRSYAATFEYVKWVQTAAILEVVHALLGFVRSPVGTTVMQISSRLFLVWAVVNLFPATEIRYHWAYSTMIFAWSIADMVRYLYYGLNLLGSQPGWLLWCRYNFFHILYPLGAGSEFLLILKSLESVRKFDSRLYWVYGALACYWPIGLYTMYTYMISQKRKVLGGARKKTA
ncbi:hypothetical protein HK097_004271 [Rhizophlyctis rosea]|uniref:Very-long-chain (3R)-3-hydroxyacyl-CoA dehydratase n=1 Tax=Rhizophlyctis rosea TaxID=64517 RepID=A0AAD5S2U8_9FUNG|nr:hypothetical protein HK097_004271 [Rhizophlyctis rosea]